MSYTMPSGGADASQDDVEIANGTFYPALSVAAFKAQTSLGANFDYDFLKSFLVASAIEVNMALTSWFSEQTAVSLAEVEAPEVDGVSTKVSLYLTAVHSRARGKMLLTVRDFDSTKSGHDKSDKLELTAEDWLQSSNEAVARLTGKTKIRARLI